MNISHHIPDETLLAYGAGTLAEVWSLVVATHLALCPQCRRCVEAVEQAGGALLDALGDDHDDAGGEAAFNRLMRATEWDVQEERAAVSTRSAPSMLPEPLKTYLGGDIHTLKWRRLGLGVMHVPIATRQGFTGARLLKVPAGRPVPLHSHKGEEFTLVLIGAFQTHQGTFARGDVEVADETVEHMPIAMPGEDCICLAVTDKPLRFKTLAARLLQPLVGI